MLIILGPRRGWLRCCSRRLWGSTGAPGLLESSEQLLHFAGLLKSIVDRLLSSLVKNKMDRNMGGSHSLAEAQVQVVQEGLGQVASTMV